MRRLALTALVPLTLGAWAASACKEPKQYEGPIPVVAGAASRNSLLLDRLKDQPEAGATQPAARARVRRMQKGEELGGPNATGRAGDFVLENDEVVFVIDQLGSSQGFAESGG